MRMVRTMQLTALWCILGCLNEVLSEDPLFICPNATSEAIEASPPVVNASVYSYRVSISVQSKNETVEAYEMYDMDRGIVQLVVNYPDVTNASHWKTEWIQYDYRYNQTLTVDMDTKACKVGDLMHNETISIFGFGVEDGFENVEYAFNWNGNYSYSLENDTYVNGVPANRYSTCLTFNNGKMIYNVDLYFSSKEWITKSGSEIPLMLVLKANSTEDGKTFDYEEYTYVFTSYQHDTTGGWNPEANNPLFNVRCDGRKDALPLPEVFTNYTEKEEMYDPEKKIILSVKRHIDFGQRLSQANFIAPKHSPYGPSLPNHRFSLIQDFHSGVQYLMDKETGNCTISNLTQSMVLFDVADHHGILSMINPATTTEERNYTYTGRHQLRKMTVDSWTSTVPLYWNMTRKGVFMEAWTHVTLIYSTPDWSNGEVSPVLLNRIYHMKITINGTTKMHTYMSHVSGRSTLFHDDDRFSLGQCFKNDKVFKFVVKFSKSYGKYVGEYTRTMLVAIRKAIAKAAGVRFVRVSAWAGMEMADDDASEDLDKSLFVSTSIYDKPMFHANTDVYKPSINLSEAVSNLKKVVASNSFQVEFNLVSGEQVQMTAFSNYFKETGALYSPKNPAPTSVIEGLSKGAIAAIGIAMIVFGFIVGAVCTHVRYKRGNRQFGYSMQD